ncbi:MAG TPA: 16S rRNA (cytosine(1402)-N(4))-methyltransferase RsmH [Bacteroidales bacterium]|nr:16S rRNA (cytosine(1402)-N(4))-methyltransferase RsmH [Bacteroidales bacterium]
MVYHISALLSESIEGLNIRPDGIYVDVTYGGGGHSAEILNRLTSGRLIAFDQDAEAERNVPDDSRILFLNQNFRFLANNLRYNGIEAIDGLLADLGVSFHQFDEPSRGFTFRQNAPLDMRMNRDNTVTAAQLLNTLDEESLAALFSEYGELPGARKIAGRIIELRNEKPLENVNDLMEAAGGLAPVRNPHKFYARLFQSLRIAVNQEITALKEMLVQALGMLNSGGRLVVITYHSLEDRLVKNFMKTGSFDGTIEKDFYGNSANPFRLITRKSITPAMSELAINNRARSARLRIAEKI